MYQGGASVELLRAAGKDPARTYGAKLKGAVRRTYDAETRGYVWCVEGGASTRLALGDASSHTSIKGGLGLHLRYVALQVKLPPGRSQFAAELSIVDQSGRRRRLLLSSSFGSITSSTLHAQLPLAADLLPRGTWCTLTLDCVALAQQAWGDCFRALDGLSIAPQCKLRCIVALRDGEVRPKCITLPKSVPMETVHIPGEVRQPTPSKAPSPLDIVGTGLRKKPNLAFGSRAPALPKPRTPLPSPPLPPPPATLPTPMPPRTPIEFFNEGVRRSGRAPPTRSTRCSRDVGFVEPGHAIRRSRKAPTRPPTPAAPHMDEAPPSYDASVYASSVLKSADFKLPPAEDEPPPSARASVEASFDASKFALPPRPTTAASAKASFDAAAYAEEAYAAARAPPAASFDDAEPAEAPAAAACEPTAAASFDGAEDELPVEASFEAADYELPPSARASVEASLDAAASAAASFDASKFALPRGDAPPAVETIRLTPAHASPRSSVASDYDASASVLLASVAHRGAPTVNVRTTSYFLNEKGAAEAPAPAPAPTPRDVRRSAVARASLRSIREDAAASPDPLEETLSLCDSLDNDNEPEPSEASAPCAALSSATTPLPEAPALRRSALRERTNESVASLRTPMSAASLVCRSAESLGAAPPSTRPGSAASAAFGAAPPSSRPGSAVSAGAPLSSRPSSATSPKSIRPGSGASAGRPRTGAPPTVDESCVGFPFADAAAPAPAAAAPSVASPAARAATPVLRSAEAAPAATPAAATPVVAEPTPPELAPPPSASPSASIERAATPGDVNAAVLAEIARLRAENAELRAANERLSPVAAPAPPPVQASLDDLPPLVDAAPAEGAAARRRSTRRWRRPSTPATSRRRPSRTPPPRSTTTSCRPPCGRRPRRRSRPRSTSCRRPCGRPRRRPRSKPRTTSLAPSASAEPEAPAPFDAAAYDRPPSARASVEPAASVRESVEAPTSRSWSRRRGSSTGTAGGRAVAGRGAVARGPGPPRPRAADGVARVGPF